jgi:molybdate transport system regulatory protein
MLFLIFRAALIRIKVNETGLPNGIRLSQKGIKMPKKPKKLAIKSKIWIEDEKGEMVFGLGRLRILGAIEKYGSILAASKSLNMSYRAAWGKIKATEQRLGKPLLTSQVGGVSGGGSRLTPFAKALVKKFEHLQSVVETEVNLFFSEHFNVELDDQADLVDNKS